MAVSQTNVLGKYRIIREIARSNDIVYEAVDPAMGRRVAIKELSLPQHLGGAQKRERIERFYREAKAAGTLTHANIVTIYDVGQENERHFIAMEYLEGHSLREIHQMQGALPVKETIEIGLQLCDALGYAHSRGVVHRDVKPDNVHILPGGIIKLTDFGIARITADPSITAQGQVFGTPSYMSPEQVASHTVDHRTDIFSLGITMYEMLTGRKPFVGDSVITITYNIMNVQPAMPVGVPPGLHAILQKALAKDVNYRYQNAAAMAADLRAEKANLDMSSRGGQPAYNPAPLTNSTFGTGTAPQFNDLTPLGGGPGMAQQSQSPPPYSPPPNNSYKPTQTVYPTPPRSQSPTHYPTAGRDPYNPNFTGRYESGGGISPQVRSTLVIVITGICIVMLALLIYWAIYVVVHSTSPSQPAENDAGLSNYAKTAVSAGNGQDALKHFEKMKQDSAPGSPNYELATQGLSEVENARGLDAVRKNQFETAESQFNKAVNDYSRNADAYLNLGNVRKQQKDLVGATEAWQAAIKADNQSIAATTARGLLAQYYLDQGKLAAGRGEIAKARVQWQQAATVDPGTDLSTQALQQINASASQH